MECVQHEFDRKAPLPSSLIIGENVREWLLVAV